MRGPHFHPTRTWALPFLSAPPNTKHKGDPNKWPKLTRFYNTKMNTTQSLTLGSPLSSFRSEEQMSIHSIVLCLWHVSGSQCMWEALSGRDNGLIRWRDEWRPALLANVVKGSFIQEATILSTVTKEQREKTLFLPHLFSGVIQSTSPLVCILFIIPCYFKNNENLSWSDQQSNPLEIWSLLASGASASYSGCLLLPHLIFSIHWSLVRKICSLPSMPFFSWHSCYSTVQPWFCLPNLFVHLWLWCSSLSKAFMDSFSCYMMLALLLIHSLCHNCTLILWMHSFMPPRCTYQVLLITDTLPSNRYLIG